MNNDAADATYWHKKYIQTLQEAQEYAAKVSADMEKLEELLGVYPMNPTADLVKAVEANLKEKNT